MNQQNWKIGGKSKKNRNNRNNKNIVNDEIQKTQINNNQQNDNINRNINGNGNNISLPCSYVLWCHNIHDNDWSLNGYTNLCTIRTVSDFWKLFNNIDKLGYKVNNFFLMKEGTDPTWEHENNRNGGICSFRTNSDFSLKLYEDLCSRLMCNILTNNIDDMDDINGISFSPKNNWAIIKIWNKNKANDLSLTLNQNILTRYRDNSIKYKSNEPEY